MLRIGEFSKMAMTTVKTLRHYDEIGLLRPAEVDRGTGYRFYDERSLLRMQEILFYRELDFSLKQIAELLSSPDYDKSRALQEQKQLLVLKKERLERLIAAIDRAGKGETVMKEFDVTQLEAYKAEAKARWGDTEAYAQYEKREKSAGNKAMQQAGDALMDIIADIAALRPLEPSSPETSAKVRALQAHITANFYECTDAILAGLGQMYVADERFRNNIDKRAGEGAAEYVSAAIAACVSK